MDIPPEKLLTRPERLRFRKSLSRLLPILLALSLISAGYYGNLRYDFITWLPSSLLLQLQGDLESRSNRELLRRFRANELTGPQARRFLLALLQPPTLTSEQHQTVDAPLRFRLSYETPLTLPAQTYFFSIADLRLKVDGHDVPQDGLSRSGFQLLEGRPVVIGPRLELGHHEFAVTGIISLHAFRAGPQQPPLVVEKPFQTTSTVQIQGELLQYVQATAEARFARRLMDTLSLAAVRRDRTGRGGVIWFRGAGVGIPVAATVLVRPAGIDADYREVGQVCLNHPFINRGAVRVDDFQAPSQGARLDVRIVPSLLTAWNAGESKCFSGAIEWRRIPLERGRPGSTGEDPADARRLTFWPPDVVTHSIAARDR